MQFWLGSFKTLSSSYGKEAESLKYHENDKKFQVVFQSLLY